MTTLRGLTNITVEVTGARGPIGLNIVGTPANGQFLVKLSSGPRDFAGASSLPAGSVVDSLTTDSDKAPSGRAVGVAIAAKVIDGNGSSTTAAPSQAAVTSRVEYWNIQEKRFAGGAPANGVDDDGPALRAALAAFRALNTSYFNGGGPRIVLPGAFLRLDTSDATKTDRALDLTGLSNLVIEGRGLGATTLNTSGAWTTIKSDDTPSQPMFRTTLRGLTIRGPGGSAAGSGGASDGIDLGATNNCLLEDIIIYAHRRGIAWADTFNTNLRNICVNGLGGLVCYDGYYAKDGTAGTQENAIKITGGQIFGVTRYGFRGENITGSYVTGLEVVQAGVLGVYFGASPSGKDLKWFDWVGGLIDTCPDMIKIDATGSTVAELVHLSELWVSNAYEALPGAAVGVDVKGLSKSTFAARILNENTYAANIQNCDRFTFSADVMTDYDKDNGGGPAIIVNNTTRSRISVGTSAKAAASSSTTALLEQGSSSKNYVTGCFNGAVSLLSGNGSRFDGVTF